MKISVLSNIFFPLEDYDINELIFYRLNRRVARQRKWGYPLLGWGLPLSLTLAAFIVDLSQCPLRPYFGKSSCWFHSRAAILIYFYGPIGCLLALNWALFGLTAWKLRNQFKNQNKSWNSQAWSADAGNMIKLHLKLFTIMGLSWLFELLSWGWPQSTSVCWPWYLWTDLVNALQGFWMLLIYVMKKSVISKLLLCHHRQ